MHFEPTSGFLPPSMLPPTTPARFGFDHSREHDHR
jgi:hypothetical protein